MSRKPLTEEQKRRERDRARAWRKANPERYVAQWKRWRERSPARIAYEQERRKRPERITAHRVYKLRELYDLSIVRYLAILSQQGERCGVCRGPWGARGPQVDHCHETGRVRGLLCRGCNLLLGLLGDTASGVRLSAERFQEYLR